MRISPVEPITPDPNQSWASRLFQTSPDSVMAGEELRIAPDGYTYTKQEFYDWYGNFEQWNRAKAIVPQFSLLVKDDGVIEKKDDERSVQSESSEEEEEEVEEDFLSDDEDEIDDVKLARMMSRVVV